MRISDWSSDGCSSDLPSALHRLGSPQAADAAPAGDTGIVGIPHDELMPKVRAALSALVDEVHRLRQELDEIQTRAVQLGRLDDEDPPLPAIGRESGGERAGQSVYISLDAPSIQ